jgi:hypothetical protein
MNNTSYGELCKRDRGLQLSRETLTYLEGWQKCIFQQKLSLGAIWSRSEFIVKYAFYKQC